MKVRRPCLVIPLTQHFSTRFFLRTGLLRKLSEWADVTMAVLWDDEALNEELRNVGATVTRLPSFRATESYYRVRRWKSAMDDRESYSNTPSIDRRRARAMESDWRSRLYEMRKDIRQVVCRNLGGSSHIRRRLAQVEEDRFREQTNVGELSAMLSEIAPTAVVTATPFVETEAMFARVAHSLGIPVFGSILSFDNLTARGIMDVPFDFYAVWNEDMKSQAMRIYGVEGTQVAVVGALQMDFYADQTFLPDKRTFLEANRLDSGRPIILFGAGPRHITPVEPETLIDLDKIVEAYPAPRRPQVLLRLHPVDSPDRWRTVLSSCTNVTLSKPWKVVGYERGTVSHDDISQLAGCLAYSDVHISTSSTMSLDGAIFDKPQVALCYDPRPGKPLQEILEDLYRREHYVPLVDSGGLWVVRSAGEMRKALEVYIANPDLHTQGRKSLIRRLCGAPLGTATDNLDRQLASFCSNLTGERSGANTKEVEHTSDVQWGAL